MFKRFLKSWNSGGAEVIAAVVPVGFIAVAIFVMIIWLERLWR